MRPVLFALVLAGLASCGSNTEETVNSSWPNGAPKEIQVVTQGQPGEEIQRFHANGRIHVRGKRVDGKKEGTWNTYREDGLPWSQVDHVGGVKQGLFRTWHTSGMPHIEGQHHQGEPVGTWDFFSSEGKWLESKDFRATE